MDKWIVTGCGVDVGKTVVSAILATLLQADYWKPIQCEDQGISDTNTVKNLLDRTKHQIHPPAYSFKTPVSPHHAARLENIHIDPKHIAMPQTKRPLVIETVGGIFVPLTPSFLTINLFATWKAKWILVSRHYVGSINHTLLTVEALRKREIPLLGLIFNGEPNPDSEKAILEISKLPFLARLLPENQIDSKTIQTYAKRWKPQSFQI